MNIKEEIKKAIKYGISLGSMEPEEQDDFLGDLFTFLIQKNNFCIFKDNNQTILITSDIEELAEIYIHAGTLKVTPLATEGYFKLFMDVLEFISTKHQKEIESLKKEENKTEGDESTEDDGDLWL